MSDSVRVNKNSLWALAGMLLTCPIFFFFQQRGDAGTGRAAWICAGMFFIAVKMRWQFKDHVWFWILIALLLTCHVLLILFVPWTDRWVPAVAILPIGVLDLLLILGCITLTAKLTAGPAKPNKEV